MSVNRLIGIDFGTSASVINIKAYRDNEPLNDINLVDYVKFENNSNVPTLVFAGNDGNYKFGNLAMNAAVAGSLHRNFKLNLVSEDRIKQREAKFLTGLFFDYLYKAYEEQSSLFAACDVETTYVSFPAKWPQETRDFMVAIAEEAGFKNVRGIDEPSAAMHSVVIQEKEHFANLSKPANIMMIDMGAGTTDLVICSYTPWEIEPVKVLCSYPTENTGELFGGSEIDEMLFAYLEQYINKCGGSINRNERQKNRFLTDIKNWKENAVSPTLKKADGKIDYCGPLETTLDALGEDNAPPFPTIDRSVLENLLKPYLVQLPKLINGCVAASPLNSDEIDFVILTGGHCQWYFVEEIVGGKNNNFGDVVLPKIAENSDRIIRLPVPQETVARGMALLKIATATEKPIGEKSDTGLAEILESYFSESESASTDEEIISDVPDNKITCLHCGNETDGTLQLRSFCKENPCTVQESLPPTPEPKKKIKCHKCGEMIPLESEFCGFCGASANSHVSTETDECRCPDCGGAVNKGAKFCGFCGAVVNSPKPPKSGTYTLVVKRKVQFVCAANKYNVYVNDVYYGPVYLGQELRIPLKTAEAEVRIECATALLKNFKTRQKISLNATTVVYEFKVEYPGAINIIGSAAYKVIG